MPARLLCVAAVLVSSALSGPAEAQPRPALYVEGGGASGLYAIGLEQTVFASASGEQRFGVRAGAGYWTQSDTFSGGRDAYLSAPVAATASFELPRVPVRFETTGGVVFGYEGFAVMRSNGAEFELSALPFGEAALRAEVTRRVFARAGAVVGGRRDFVTDAPVAPALAVGMQL